MKNKRLTRNFYTKPTLTVSKKLLGKYIVRKVRGKELVGKIIETEAYIGPQDKASHAYNDKITPRNKVEYLIGGHIYIYLVYGMYWQLNIVTAKQRKPECVLIRALDLDKIANGPGKVCNYLKLDKSFYQEDLSKSKRIWLEDRGEKIKACQISATKRIGIDYAGLYWSRRKWRFVLKNQTLNSVYCPYLKEKVLFNVKGLHHLKFKSDQQARAQKDQYPRLKLLYLAPQVLSKSHTLQGIWRTRRLEPHKTSGKWKYIMKDVIFYEFIAVLENVRIKVIVKEVFGGERYFWSVIPYWSIDKLGSKRILYAGNPDSD